MLISTSVAPSRRASEANVFHTFRAVIEAREGTYFGLLAENGATIFGRPWCVDHSHAFVGINKNELTIHIDPG